MNGGASNFWIWMIEVGVLHAASALLVCLHVLRGRREAASAILWMVLAWSAPFVGALIYVMFGVNRVHKKGWQRRVAHDAFRSERTAREEETLPMAYWRAVRESGAAVPLTPLAAEINRSMQADLPDFPLLGGNSVDLLVTGEEAFPAMREAIRSARHHVHLQTFILGTDRVAREFLDLLEAKAREGVQVRMLFDRFGSTRAVLSGLVRRYRGRHPNLRIADWTQVNPLKRQFQINLRNHRKLLVVDGERAITGGINLQEINCDRPGAPAHRDINVRLRGAAVQELQFSFLSDWHFMTDENPDGLLCAQCFPRQEAAGSSLVRVVHSGPSEEPETLTDVFFNALVSARRQVLAATPYFVPPPEIRRALRSAAQRGVEVKLLVPRDNNHVYAGLAGRSYYEDLLDAGVRLFERRPPFMHTKALIVDGEAVIVGTANLDMRSLKLNYETNLLVFDENVAGRLKAFLLGEFACADEIDADAWRRRPLRDRLLQNFCSLMSPVL